MTRPFQFSFDISAKSAKQKKARRGRSMSGAVETSQQQCQHLGCNERGQYRAPRSADQLDDYLWFCQKHVRDYNLKWNFLQGRNVDDIEQQYRSDRVWNRETRPFSHTRNNNKDPAWKRHGINHPRDMLGDNATQNPGTEGTGSASNMHRRHKINHPTVQRALRILHADGSWTLEQIRKQYKSLVKDLHPDMNGGDRTEEEQLTQVVWAWQTIQTSGFFRN